MYGQDTREICLNFSFFFFFFFKKFLAKRPAFVSLPHRIVRCVFADGDRQEVERDHRSSDAVSGARGESDFLFGTRAVQSHDRV